MIDRMGREEMPLKFVGKIRIREEMKRGGQSSKPNGVNT
jgi:hypothetical protein